MREPHHIACVIVRRLAYERPVPAPVCALRTDSKVGGECLARAAYDSVTRLSRMLFDGRLIHAYKYAATFAAPVLDACSRKHRDRRGRVVAMRSNAADARE